jgi:periplasmic divalent cation tolerance protein
MALAQLITTVSSREQAVELGHAVVDERVAACVQVLGPITSVFRWEGSVREEQEYLCLMKVPSERLERLLQFVRGRHPYDTPELTVVNSDLVDERYVAWAESETVGPGRDA